MKILEFENSQTEYKSLKKVIGKAADIKDLAKTCVCLANAHGGYLIIGIEDKDKLPPIDQKINDNDINETIKKLRAHTDSVAITTPEKHLHENGGEFFSIRILPTQKTIAMTTDGKVYSRVGDECVAVNGVDLTRIVAEKGAFQWELVTLKINISQIDVNKLDSFVHEIRSSDRVSDFVKDLSNIEILEYYNLVYEGNMTNLGVLWLGDFKQRSRLSYPLTVQYIVYNENEEKIRKEEWTLNQLNPKELLLDIEKKATELTYSFELPDGMFRKKVRHYPAEVIRELLVNAFVHKSFTISGDIFINVFPNRLIIKNPGGLPLGITKENILHQVQRRNPHLIDTFKALKLMENEGSGYDLIFEKLSKDGKPYPEIDSDINATSVTIYSNIIDPEILEIIDYIAQHYQLSQREMIALGAITRHKKVSAHELSKILQLNNDERLRDWIGKLIDRKIIVAEGKTKGVLYQVNPKLLASLEHNLKPSLKTMEEHKVKALIIEDLKVHPKSKSSDIHSRLDDLNISYIRKIIYGLRDEGAIIAEGARKNSTYSLANKK